MSDPNPMLDSGTLSGVVELHRWLGPPRHVVGVEPTADLAALTQDRCGIWGGAAHLLVPVENGCLDSTLAWARIVAAADFDRAEGAPELDPKRLGVPWPAPLLLAVAALGLDREALLPVVSPVLDASDPWLLAYLAAVGSLPLAPSAAQVARFSLRPDVTYDEVLRVERPVVDGGAQDLIHRLRQFDSMSPRIASTVELSMPGLSRSVGSPPLFPRDQHRGGTVGPDVVVVYTPGSVEDFSLLWNIRASAGRTMGLPLGVPVSSDVVNAIRYWDREGAGMWGPNFALGDGQCLTSATVSVTDLESIADELGSMWFTATPEQILLVADPPGRASGDVVTFNAGRARVRRWSDEDRRTFKAIPNGRDLGLRVRFRPQDQRLPDLPSLRVETHTNGIYAGGAYEVSGSDSKTSAEISWPTGWTVLEAFARDRDLQVRPSAAGKAAEAFIRRLGGLREVALLASPDVLKLVYRLGERAGMTWFRSRLDEVLATVRSSEDAEPVVNAYLAELAASPDDADTRSVTASEFRDLGSREEVRSWVEWAEDHGVLVRGVVVSCDNCAARSWRSPTELSPPIVCHPCGEVIRRPFRHDQMPTVRYRASDGLLRILGHDALGHVLVVQWMTSLFHRGFDQPEDLFGGHPGVEFLREGRVVGEADVFLLFSDGSSAVGEYKRSGAGLNDEELTKLGQLADLVGADWSFVATHQFHSELPPQWAASDTRLPQRPRFVLVGEHLFSHPFRSLGDDPFAWPTDETAARTRHEAAPGAHAKWLEDIASPDAAIHEAWRHLDSKRSDRGGEG